MMSYHHDRSNVLSIFMAFTAQVSGENGCAGSEVPVFCYQHSNFFYVTSPAFLD